MMIFVQNIKQVIRHNRGYVAEIVEYFGQKGHFLAQKTINVAKLNA